MGIQSLQTFIETNCSNACVTVDLLKIARGLAVGRRHGHGHGGGRHARLCLVIDGECCLDRLYGGYYSDWACGGQWNRMLQFLSVLVQTIHTNNLEVVVFFNGSLEPQRIDEWIKQQNNDRKKINQIIKHVNIRATPPPKVWWLPPMCLRSCLRMALRHLNVPVVCSMDDHHQEVIAYCRENLFHGVVAEDAEYAIFDPPRYFSSELLKLTYKGSLETKEIILDEVAKSMNLHPKRFCVFAALLGNYLLRDEDLASFYQTLVKDSKTNSDTLIKALISYVRELPAIDNVDGIGCQVFGSPSNSVNQERIQRFKECVQYYLNGTKDGFLRYRPPHIGRRQDAGRQVPSHMQPKKHTQQPKIKIKQKESSVANDTPSSSATSQNENDATPNPTDASKFASETEENEIMSLSAYKEATVSAPVPAPEIVIEPPNALQQDQNTPAEATVNEVEEKQNKGDQKTTAVKSNGGTSLLSNSTSSSSSDSSPSRVSPEVSTWSANNQKKAESAAAAVPKLLPLPKIPPEVMRTASERHQKGLMSPWIYQILTQGEIKIPVSIEEEIPKDLPSGNAMYRNLRQSVYAVLFNLHHIIFMAKQKGHSEDTIQDIIVKEWSWCKSNQYKSPELVKAVQLGWKVPTIQRLWFGSTLEDKRRRMRVFLSCLRSDTPLMLKTSNVPQHLLILCCVLRYLLSDQTMRVLQKQELDAFLAQAVSPQLMDAQGIQLMQLPLVTNRGIQLASLFMQGVEHALFVNDACGAPVPWLMCCVWLFFDGKLFHQKLLKAHTAKNLTDICDGQLDQVVKVERMRAAILENLQVQFARPPLAMGGSNHFSSIPPGHMNHHMNPGSMGRGRGGKKMYARGGQLEIAGVVVGSWGANYGQVPARSRGMSMSSGMTPAGATFSRPGGLRGMNRNYSNSNYQNRYMQTYPGYPGRAGRRPGGGGGNSNNNANKSGKQNKKKNSFNKSDKSDKNKKNNNTAVENNKPAAGVGRGCTMEMPDEQTVVLEEVSEESNSDEVPITNGHVDDKFVDADENISSHGGGGDDADSPGGKPDEVLTKSPDSGVNVSNISE